eukprot:CAMPEP_0174380798 /NCGR_PEP_ID=MMETSP0811_2-20130205/123602_1 /TAXON_ID=73025 ORGANISM="Eutreptiella gymnastica-like, Strain CCMP1594" /NCGR_SAMPLE_ID=MMETSP0811_2 /ASSEMBLY_ACC=CAM_ASM_000667 /LENGTH=85 /DNA_ID=CAMNT_0015533757 /DNA_START=2591 /DNA_END=2844 /DNA_ORIENTATION=+
MAHTRVKGWVAFLPADIYAPPPPPPEFDLKCLSQWGCMQWGGSFFQRDSRADTCSGMKMAVFMDTDMDMDMACMNRARPPWSAPP